MPMLTGVKEAQYMTAAGWKGHDVPWRSCLVEVTLDNHHVPVVRSVDMFHFLYLYNSLVWSYCPSRLSRFTLLIRSFARWEKCATDQKSLPNGFCRVLLTALHPGCVGCLSTCSLVMPQILWFALGWRLSSLSLARQEHN